MRTQSLLAVNVMKLGHLDSSDAAKCIAQCCLNYEKAFQPLDKAVLNSYLPRVESFCHNGTNSFLG